MRFPAFVLILISSLLMVSCRENKLPAIEDSQVLVRDCAILFQQFPLIVDTNQAAKYEAGYTNSLVRSIPPSKWPLSIQNLKPFDVERSNWGIRIWIETNRYPTETMSGNWVVKGYFIPCSHFSIISPRSNVPFYKQTDLPGIYEVTMPAVAF